MTPDDFDPARGYDDNPPTCLRCDARDQEIEALRQQVATAREIFEAMAEFEPQEVCKDEFAYDRLLNAFRVAALAATEATR